MKIVIFITILVSISMKDVLSLFCYWNTGCPYKYLANRTPYNAVRGDIRDSAIKLNGCEPISIWGYFRHGKKYPKIKFSKQMKSAVFVKDYVGHSYHSGNSSLCAQDVENLLKPFDEEIFKEEFSEHLTPEGREDMVGIGKRLQQAFPDLLKELKTEDVTLRLANESWVENSINFFLKGLGSNDLINHVAPPSKEDIEMILPYHMCEIYWSKVVKKSEEIKEKYLAGPEYLSAKDRIHRRTGINITLNDDQIIALYDLCRYTWSGLDNKPSPWCAIFTTEDLKVLEYMEDLAHYYRASYGHPIIKKLAFPLVENMWKSFNDVLEGRGKKIVANFGRNKMLSMLYAALGLNKDDEVLTTAKRDPGRRWRSSLLTPFSANFMAILYRCPSDQSIDYNVVFYQNEEPLGSICPNRVCSWQEFEDQMKPFVNSNIDFCKDDSLLNGSE